MQSVSLCLRFNWWFQSVVFQSCSFYDLAMGVKPVKGTVKCFNLLEGFNSITKISIILFQPIFHEINKLCLFWLGGLVQQNIQQQRSQLSSKATQNVKKPWLEKHEQKTISRREGSTSGWRPRPLPWPRSRPRPWVFRVVAVLAVVAVVVLGAGGRGGGRRVVVVLLALVGDGALAGTGKD